MIKQILRFSLLICLSLSVFSSSAQQVMQVKGRHLFDPCGEQVVMRGVN